MKSYLKRFGALLMAAVMVLSMSITAFAEDGPSAAKPTEEDRGTITVDNVEAGLTVTAYQIVKADYNDEGFIGYSAVDGVTLANVVVPTADEVTTIAKNTTGLPSQVLTGNGTKYTADVAPGYWIILVTGSGTKVYNPMLAGLYYSENGSDNTMENKPVDANTHWTLASTDAYAKSSEVSVEKAIVNLDGSTSKGDDMAIGDTVTFEVKTTIPSYSKEYTHATFVIHDELSKGLSFTEDLQESLQASLDAAYGAGNATATIDGQKLTVAFDSEYVLANGLKDVVIQYSAVLNENAGINFDKNTNKAVVEYTNDPTETSDNDKKTNETPGSVTYHYTFGINANLNGEGSDKTQEVFKVDEDGNVTVVDKEVKVENPLSGATFELRNAEGTLVGTAVSGDDGTLTFTGLDAGTYSLVETEAPKGYSLDPTPHPVVISAEYNEDGTLASYTITIDNEATSTYKASYEGEGTITTIDKTQIGAAAIKNTKLNNLPSTGGIGTYIFTIGGVVIMGAAAGMFFMSRKRKAASDK